MADKARHRLVWEHGTVRVSGRRLCVAGRDAETRAREHGTRLCGFEPGEISCTGTKAAERDLDALTPLAALNNLAQLKSLTK